MYKPNHILVPVAVGPNDDAALAEQLVDDAASLVPKGGRMTLLYIDPPPTAYFGTDTGFAPPAFYAAVAELYEQNRGAALEKLKKLKVRAEGRGLVVATRAMEPIEGVGEAIAHCAAEVGADTIAVSSHSRRGLKRLFLGSVAERVAHLAPVPVMIFRATTPT